MENDWDVEVLKAAVGMLRAGGKTSEEISDLMDMFAVLIRASVKTCEHCGGEWYAGPGTGRNNKSSAKWCSDRCRVAGNRALRSARAVEKPDLSLQ